MPSRTIGENSKILILSLPLLVVALYQEWRDYFELWSTSYVYGHGFLVLAGTAYLLYVRKTAFQQLPTSFSWTYLTVFLALIAILLLAHSGNIKIVRMLMLPFILIGWGSTIWGKEFMKLAGIPLALILFGAPFWDEMSPALQWLTVAVDERILSLISIPAVIDKFYITIPSGTFFVANGCSGIRYLVVALYLGAFYGALTNSSVKRIAGLMTIAGFLALLSNWVRVAWIIAAGHYTNMESSLVEDHELFGWGVFIAITLLPFLIVTHYFDRATKDSAGLSVQSIQPLGKGPHSYKAILSATIPLIVVPSFLLLQNQLAIHNSEDWRPTLPETNSEDWAGPIRYAGFWKPQYQSADIHLSAVYIDDEHFKVQLDFYGYRQQNQGKELIYYRNTVYNTELWTSLKKEQLTLETDNAWGIEQVNQVSFSNKVTDEAAVVWFWYDIAGTLLTFDSEVQVVGGLKSLLGDKRAGVWILSTECSGDAPDICKRNTKHRFESFLQSTQPAPSP